MFTQLGSLIKTLPRRSKTPGSLVALHVRQAFTDCLKKSFSDLPIKTLEGIKASAFKNGTLSVIAPGLVGAELSMRSGGLIKDINTALGRRVVLKLKIKNS